MILLMNLKKINLLEKEQLEQIKIIIRNLEIIKTKVIKLEHTKAEIQKIESIKVKILKLEHMESRGRDIKTHTPKRGVKRNYDSFDEFKKDKPVRKKVSKHKDYEKKKLGRDNAKKTEYKKRVSTRDKSESKKNLKEDLQLENQEIIKKSMTLYDDFKVSPKAKKLFSMSNKRYKDSPEKAPRKGRKFSKKHRS